MTPRALPLCVDLDGSLSRVDTLHEGVIALAKSAPLDLFQMPRWLASGKAMLKQEVMARVPLDVQTLPLHPELLDWLRAEKAAGRRLYLVTAADRSTATALAQYLNLFDDVLASDGSSNLAGDAKRDALVARFGQQGYDYVGDSTADFPVWRSSENAIVVGNEAFAERVAQVRNVSQRFAPLDASWKVWIKAVRLHQWVKNLLIFIPALLAHQIFAASVQWAVLLAFLSFGLCASSVYIFNDLLDLPSDRRHPRKRFRPFAAGVLPAVEGVKVGAALLLGAVGLALMVNGWFLLSLLTYFALTLAYSLYLKRLALIDVMLLAGLYTMRIIAGGAATLIWPSFWLLAFSVFLFLSLGIVKRYAELNDIAAPEEGVVAHGRGYSRADLPLLQTMGITAGYIAVVVMALYINSTASASLYTRPQALWMLCPAMLFWISRVWLHTTRGRMHDDPIVFALKDRPSLALAALMSLIVLASI